MRAGPVGGLTRDPSAIDQPKVCDSPVSALTMTVCWLPIEELWAEISQAAPCWPCPRP
jgi:hypothetical protein